jgi:hypothetical protein
VRIDLLLLKWQLREALQGDMDTLCKVAPRTGRPVSVMAEMESRIVQASLH